MGANPAFAEVGATSAQASQQSLQYLEMGGFAPLESVHLHNPHTGPPHIDRTA